VLLIHNATSKGENVRYIYTFGRGVVKLTIPGVPLPVSDVGHGGSLTTEVRRVLFDVRIRRYQYSLNLYHHSLGTPVGGQFSYVY